MKMLYLDCAMGAAGDMLAAALLELLDAPETAVETLNALGIPGVTYLLERMEKCGVCGSHLRVLVHDEEEGEGEHHHHHHTNLGEIRQIVSGLNASEAVKARVLAVYGRIAAAESAVHGEKIEEVHFHEVGAMDAVADITAVCWLMERLQPEAVTASAIHVGCGTVRCAHGVLPVPAPATARLLDGVPTYGGEIEGELCTPTGAALLTEFASNYGEKPVLFEEKTGFGMGRKEFPRANCLRAVLGETEQTAVRDTVAE